MNFNEKIESIIKEIKGFEKLKHQDNLYHLDSRYNYGKYMYDRINNNGFNPPINLNGYVKDDKDLDNSKYIQFLNLKEIRYCLMCEMIRYIDKTFSIL